MRRVLQGESPLRHCHCHPVRRRPERRRKSSAERLDPDQRQRQVVAGTTRALAGLAHQHLGCFARRQRMHDRAEFAWREVVPQAVAAAQDAVADVEASEVAQRQRRILEGAQAARQQIRLRMRVRLVLGDLRSSIRR